MAAAASEQGFARAARVQASVATGALGWMAVAAIVAAFAYARGLSLNLAGAALALALAPALATLVLAPRLDERWAQAVAVFSWLAFALVGMTLTGGVASPMIACVIAAPALGRLVGAPRLAGEACAFAALAVIVASFAPGVGLISPAGLPTAAAAAALALGAFWLAREPSWTRTAGPGETPGPGGSALVLDRAGRIAAAGPFAAARLGALAQDFGPGRMLVETLRDRLDAADAATLAKALADAAATGAARADLILRLPEGAEGVAVDIVADGDRLHASFLDATGWMERIGQLQLALEAQDENAKARHQRMAELSHELRTPLTHILGFTEILSRKLYGDLNAKQAEYVELIRKSGSVLLELITGLMDLSRVESGRFPIEKEHFDVRDLVGEVVRLTADAAAGRGIALTGDVPGEPLMLEADPRAVRQILANLTNNALKFSPPETSVRVIARRAGDAVVLEVADRGPGIPPAERARLGQAFARGSTSRGVEGVGLGLALVRGFAELHHGELFVAENPGGGALVGVRLPASAAAPAGR
jgi:cell cycle sensor histidine kinase DivJ